LTQSFSVTASSPALPTSSVILNWVFLKKKFAILVSEGSTVGDKGDAARASSSNLIKFV